MLEVKDALEKILAAISPLPAEIVPIIEAAHRVLAADIYAPHDLPPFANSSMDGYAVVAADIAHSSSDRSVRLPVIEDIPAGKAPRKPLKSGQAARIMTGAPLPEGADAVVPVELTDDTGGSSPVPAAVGILEPVPAGANIRPRGEDIQNGELVLPAGRRLRPADIGVLAGLGLPEVSVIRRPRIAVLSTGDELLTPDQPLTPGKIRDMNGYVLPALIQELGATALRMGIAGDTVESVRDHLNAAVEQGADLILSSAGVSVGAFDVVKTVLEELGKVDFWRINMRPGKPLTFGRVRDIPFLGLPGNPVSAMVTFDVFARPIIRKMLSLPWDAPTRTARLGEAMSSDGRMTYARVRLVHEDGELVAYSTGTQSSGALSSMIKADGLLIIPAGITSVAAGETLAVRPFSQDM